MIRILILIVPLLVSCTSFDLGYFAIFREAMSNGRISDLESLDSKNISYLKASLGRNQATFVLSDYSNGLETWIGSNGQKILTTQGFVVKTQGLQSNLNYYETKKIAESFLKGSFVTSVDFSSPELIYTSLELELLEVLITKDCDKLYIYNKVYKDFPYSNKEFFCFNNGKPIYSIQRLTPLEKELKLEFFYKYK